MVVSSQRPPRRPGAAKPPLSTASNNKNPFAAVLRDDDDESGRRVGKSVFVDDSSDDDSTANQHPRPPRPATGKPPLSEARNNKNPFAAVLHDNGDGGVLEARRSRASSRGEGAAPAPASRRVLADSSDDDDSDDDDESEHEEEGSSSTSQRGRQSMRPPRPSMAGHRRSFSLTASAKRRRRRSSGRFLQLSGNSRRFSGTGSIDGQENNSHNLNELYQKAIRMNAENKINAGNSWNLKLIENIDKFLEMDDDNSDKASSCGSRSNSNNNNDMESDEPEEHSDGPQQRGQQPQPSNKKKRVNFTKASCTLDASVRIYSYRVDDVHLTSYKVLANLNRTDTNKKNNKRAADDEDNDGTQGNNEKHHRTKSNNASTLENNVANINLNKLDSAFDIDPLFHKMSKTFDEGGAKGLLLVNLGVGENGCNIVFDSSEDPEGEKTSETTQGSTAPRIAEGMMDITNLSQKLESLMMDDEEETIESLPLVPQLTGLRAEHDSLDKDGFVDTALAATVGPKTPGRRRYHADPHEELEATRSIHKEAMERSRLSAGRSLSMRRLLESPEAEGGGDDAGGGSNLNDDDDDGGFVDFGGGFDDGDDDDGGFVDFIANAAGRYSEISFQSGTAAPADTTTMSLLDAIASGQTALSGNDYEYFAKGSNQWAGAAHWKRKNNQKTTAATKKKNKPKKKTTAKSKKKAQTLFPLSIVPDVSKLLPKSNAKRKPSSQLSKAMITKLTNNENLLPEDAGVRVEQLTQLFLRPNTVVKQDREQEDDPQGKTVGFQLPDTATAWDDGSFGGGGGDYDDDDNDGPGFAFAGDNDDGDDDDDEFLVQELEDVRKVEKVQVGYAVVAKKVDVKRLKRDLWTELENRFVEEEVDKESDDEDDDMDDGEEEEKQEKNKGAVSFQDVVNELELQKTQMDVTLPFYFICALHLANERGLRLESKGLEDFVIHYDDKDHSQSF